MRFGGFSLILLEAMKFKKHVQLLSSVPDGLAGLRLRLVVPITGWKSAFANIPWLVQITPTPQNGLTKVSAANPLQTRSVSLERFTDKMGVLEETILEEIVLALGIVIQYS